MFMENDSNHIYQLDVVVYIVDRWIIPSCKTQRSLVSAFVERWCPKTHTFHMSFEEYIVTLQDVAYQLGFLIDDDYVNGCLTDFERFVESSRLAWTCFEELLDILLSVNYIYKFIVKCTELSPDADEEIKEICEGVMLLLSTQLFCDKYGTHLHIWWLPYILELYRSCMVLSMHEYSRVSNKNVVKLATPLQLLQSWIFWRFPTFKSVGFDAFHLLLVSSATEVLQRVHLDILDPQHTMWIGLLGCYYNLGVYNIDLVQHSI
ncbi:hypothetical protein Ahy_A01g004509 [Arachis hypogaea]|uniref:Aminotransferase-like plant mobile domain-containing protein n=1 Tax=Arachis hypogaea TaxID=3818 RepID=A0A445EW99_ARAHY|nr:hypothetical protein Ahy_A01g004509 [Arachis hypogaea]